MLFLVTLMLVIVLIATLAGDLTGNTLPGSTYLSIVDAAEDIGLIFGVAILVVTAGVNLMTRSPTRSWIVYAASVLAVLGLAACFWLFIELRDYDVARPVWNRADTLTSYGELQEQHKRFLRLLATWLGTVLATQAGVEIVQALRRRPATSSPAKAAQDDVEA